MLSAEDCAIIRKKLGREPTDVELACFENLGANTAVIDQQKHCFERYQHKERMSF